MKSSLTTTGIPTEILGPIMDRLRTTLRASGYHRDSSSASVILTLHFDDDLTTTLVPVGEDRIRYSDDSFCFGVDLEFLDPELNALLRDLPNEVLSHARKLRRRTRGEP